MRISGIIEGFYGPPWSHADRLTWIDRLDEWGMSHYVWAAKAEPRHRERWREPFTDLELTQFAELAARRTDVTLAVGLTPGADATTDEIVAKLAPAIAAGAGVAVLSCDDLPALDAGAAHRDLAHALLDRLGCGVWIVPTHYSGVEGSPYLNQLTAGLADEVEVMWTGRRVVNDSITADETRRWTSALGRPPLVWDNTPVNDAMMRESLHLGPLSGRDPLLRTMCSGILWNPMEFAAASVATLASAAAWLRGDDPLDAWRHEVLARGWYHLALATSFHSDSIWPGDDPDAAFYQAMLDGLPTEAAAVGLDDGTQPWIDAAREGAAIAIAAINAIERASSRGSGTALTVRQVGLAMRWRAWRRCEAATFGSGLRIRPVLGQDHRGEFVTERTAFELRESPIDLVVRRSLPA